MICGKNGDFVLTIGERSFCQNNIKHNLPLNCPLIVMKHILREQIGDGDINSIPIVLIILDHLMRIITPQQCIYPYHDSAMKASGKNLDSQSVLNLIAFKLAIEY